VERERKEDGSRLFGWDVEFDVVVSAWDNLEFEPRFTSIAVGGRNKVSRDQTPVVVRLFITGTDRLTVPTDDACEADAILSGGEASASSRAEEQLAGGICFANTEVVLRDVFVDRADINDQTFIGFAA
jgi:hypothetical protein